MSPCSIPRRDSTVSAMRPVVLVHGWGGSFDATWRSTGFTELLKDAGREVIGVDLLGHGTAPKPHEPEAYADMTARVVEALPDEPVDAIGFSLGAMTLLRLAVDAPGRFARLVLAGIGRNVLEPDEAGHARIVAALEGRGDPEDNLSRMFVQYASQPGNDLAALTAVMKRARTTVFRAEDLAVVTCPTLVVIGEKDFAGPGDVLADALPNGRLKVLPRVDHFATPESFGFIDATLEFLDAIPS